MGAGFGLEEMLKRQDVVCGQIVPVCEPKRPPPPMSDCRACAEAFMDFGHILQRDRRDIDVGDMKIKRKNPTKADREFRGRSHIFERMQQLCGSSNNRHTTKEASVIQEMCEEVTEEHEGSVMRAFVDGGKKG
jgi:hypothetical protein